MPLTRLSVQLLLNPHDKADFSTGNGKMDDSGWLLINL
jgi:hypothetical protein